MQERQNDYNILYFSTTNAIHSHNNINTEYRLLALT